MVVAWRGGWGVSGGGVSIFRTTEQVICDNSRDNFSSTGSIGGGAFLSATKS